MQTAIGMSASLVASVLMLALLAPTELCAKSEDAGAADKQEKSDANDKTDAGNAKAKEQQHWENAIQFFGEEDTGSWSLRVEDRNVHERAQFRLLELWTYDRK